MDKRIILSVAGSGKTTYIVNNINPDQKSLVLTYTRNNLDNLRNKIFERFGCVPNNILLLSYFTFLYSFCFKPFLWKEFRTTGINYSEQSKFPRRIPRDNHRFWTDSFKRLYHSRISRLLLYSNISDLIKNRLEKYFDSIYIDEIQDFGGFDFDFLEIISSAQINTLFVGDFYQHTFDTSRDGNKNCTLHECCESYMSRLGKMGLDIDCETLKKSYRCSPTLCAFIRENLEINMFSNRKKGTAIVNLLDNNSYEKAKKVLNCNNTVKLFYQKHYKHHCYSRNWGDSKGEDHYVDVCVILNKSVYEKFRKGKLDQLKPMTRNKFYVACTRTSGNLFFISPDLFEKISINQNEFPKKTKPQRVETLE